MLKHKIKQIIDGIIATTVFKIIAELTVKNAEVQDKTDASDEL